MLLPLQALVGAVTSLRAHLPCASSLKIAGAFAGGVACTGVAVAAWSGSLGFFGPGANQPDRPQIAAAGAGTESPAAAPREDSKQPETTGSAAADNAPSTTTDDESRPADAAKRDGCENQVWPYIDQHCLTRADSDSAAPSQQRVRIVSTDATIASDRTPNPPAPSVSAAKGNIAQAPTLPSLPMPLPDPRKARGDTAQRAAIAPATPRPATPQPALPQPETRSIASSASSDVSSVPQPVEQPPAPEVRSGKRHADGTTSKRRQRRGDERWAKSRRDRSLQPREDAPAEQRSDGLVRPRHDGRQVTVEQTYRLPDGRRVLVRRSYRAIQEREVRDSEAHLYRRPFAGYHPQASPRYIADDDD